MCKGEEEEEGEKERGRSSLPNSLALGKDYGSWSFTSTGQADVGGQKK